VTESIKEKFLEARAKGLHYVVLDCLSEVTRGCAGRQQWLHANARVYCCRGDLYCPCQAVDDLSSAMKACKGNELYNSLRNKP